MQHYSAFATLIKNSRENITTCNISEFKQYIDGFDASNIVILDVRELEEFNAGYIPNAIHLSKGMIEVKIESVVADKKQKIFLYCGSGARSVLASVNLVKMGYENIISVDGGFKSWIDNGNKVVK